MSRKKTEKLLHGTHKTEDNYLYNIVFDGEITGYLWAGCSDLKHQAAFIYALEIKEEYRRKGYGKKAFVLIEDELKKRGYLRIRLHGFEQNKAAIKIYDSLGYKRVSRVMQKEID